MLLGARKPKYVACKKQKRRPDCAICAVWSAPLLDTAAKHDTWEQSIIYPCSLASWFAQ